MRADVREDKILVRYSNDHPAVRGDIKRKAVCHFSFEGVCTDELRIMRERFRRIPKGPTERRIFGNVRRINVLEVGGPFNRFHAIQADAATRRRYAL